MIRLQKSESLKRKIRQDDTSDLAIPSWDLVREAVLEGKATEAIDLMEYECGIDKALHDLMVQMLDDFVTHIAVNQGEEEIEKVWRRIFTPFVKNRVALSPTVEETLQMDAEFARAHFGDFTVVEEPDRYVLTCHPCGSGGRLRQLREVKGTKKAYPWSWSKTGVSYYCIHCPLMWEIIPTEIQGYPIRINLLGDKPGDPCIHLHYKKPELIPEEYFTRIGKTKTVK